jgi:hypothetical protein
MWRTIMKTILVAAVMTCASCASALVEPIIISKSYTNNAWGYQNFGCLVDHQGYVYTYDVGKEQPIQKIASVSEEKMELINRLLVGTADGTVSPVRKTPAMDIGITSWTGLYADRVITIKSVGRYSQTNSADEAEELASLIDEICSDTTKKIPSDKEKPVS